MRYTMQVKVKVGTELEWRNVHPTNGPDYVYETRDEAERMLKMCYPDCDETRARVEEVQP